MKGLMIMLLLSLIIGTCVAFCIDIADFQAYTRKNLQPFAEVLREEVKEGK